MTRERPLMFASTPTEPRTAADADASVGPAAHLLARDVSITYRSGTRHGASVLAVGEMSLTVRRGEMVCIVGPSGCGKTTFLNAVAGFLPISEGTLELEGRPIDRPGPDRAMVFQHASLLPWRTALRNVTYGLELAGMMRRAPAERRARELLEMVGLAEFAEAYPNKLSGGMQQRVNLARALAVEPELLLLDEPFASVDAQTRETLQAQLLRIREQTGVSALFVTHDISEAVYLGDRVCVFSARPGRVISDTAIALGEPGEPRVRRGREFIGYVDQVADSLAAATEEEGQ